MKKAVAFLRVTSGAIKSFTFNTRLSPTDSPQKGEAMEFRAVGYWMPSLEDDPFLAGERFPTSLHFIVPVGHGIGIPTGDFLKVTIERATAEEMQAQPLEFGGETEWRIRQINP